MFLLIIANSLFGASPKESLTLQEFRIELQELGRAFDHQKKDLEIVQDTLASITQSLESTRKELEQTGKAEVESSRERVGTLDKRLANLETSQKSLISDLKTLKDHLNETQGDLAKFDEKLTRLDKELVSDMKSLKSSIQSMMALLQKDSPGSSNFYVVQPGDSLGKIAQDNKISVKRLKELNHLVSDQIYAGQKLILQ